MRILIVESRADHATAWQTQLEGEGHVVDSASRTSEAVTKLTLHPYAILILNVHLTYGPGLSVADYARYRRPEAQVIFMTDTDAYSDGSIFTMMPNARAFLPSGTPPEDIAALVEHYGRPVRPI